MPDQPHRIALKANKTLWTKTARWKSRLIATSMILFAASFTWLWIQVFYLKVPANSFLSFASSDPFYLPPHIKVGTLLGVHYFGDFQIEYAYGHLLRVGVSPYVGTFIHDDQSPFSAVVFSSISVISAKKAAILYFSATLIALFIPSWKLLRSETPSDRLTIIGLLGVLSIGFISAMDRGNDLGLTMGLVAGYLLASKVGWKTTSLVFISIAIAFKGYPVVLLIIPLGLRRYKFALYAFLIAVVLNLFPLFFFPGSIDANFRNVIPSLTSLDLHQGTQLLSWNAYSPVPKIAELLCGTKTSFHLLMPNQYLLGMFGFAYLTGVFIVIRYQRIPQWCWGPLALSTLQMVVPLSYSYSAIWSFVGSIWFITANVFIENYPLMSDRVETFLRTATLVALAATVVPCSVQLYGASDLPVSLSPLLSSISLLFLLVIALFFTFKPSTPELIFVSRNTVPFADGTAQLPEEGKQKTSE
jgi:Glycosyltransferase family 87